MRFGANCVALAVSENVVGGAGGLSRRSPTGAAAYRTPRKTRRFPSTEPRQTPSVVCAWSAASGGGSGFVELVPGLLPPPQATRKSGRSVYSPYRPMHRTRIRKLMMSLTCHCRIQFRGGLSNVARSPALVCEKRGNSWGSFGVKLPFN